MNRIFVPRPAAECLTRPLTIREQVGSNPTAACSWLGFFSPASLETHPGDNLESEVWRLTPGYTGQGQVCMGRFRAGSF
jgi:hypothetical protein